MEKPTSSFIKSFRYLIFCITFSSFIIFLSLLYLWVTGAVAPFPQAANLLLLSSPPNSSLNLSSFPTTPNGLNSRKVKNSVFATDSNWDTHQRAQQFSDASTPGRVSRKCNVSEVSAFEVKLGDIFLGDNTSFSVNSPQNASPGFPQIISSEVAPNSKEPVEALSQTDERHPGLLMVEQYSATSRSSNSYDSTLGRAPNGVSDSDSVIKALPPVVRSRTNKENSRGGSCDVTKGKWVFDESYPLYSNATCPFIDEGFSCQSNGRLDKDYMKWRWQPNDCNFPRFNPSEMLEVIRGKRLVFVGDSLNRNQWESMLCLLISAIKDPNKVYEARGRKITQSRGDYSFKFVDYKCTVEYYVSHFLVRETKARIGKKKQQTLRIDAIDRGSSRWRGADILVFNTAHWWSHHKTKAGINYYQEGSDVYPHLDVSMAFRKAMITWATWIDNNINPKKTQVFFRSYSPAHFSGGQWDSGGHCKEASQPSNTSTSVSYEKNMVVEDVLTKKMTTPVTLLNITEMSNYRRDGHPSIYGRFKTRGVEDCSHWCLPGVPDSWNEMLYYHILK